LVLSLSQSYVIPNIVPKIITQNEMPAQQQLFAQVLHGYCWFGFKLEPILCNGQAVQKNYYSK